MIDEFELFCARAYGRRDAADRDVIRPGGNDVTSGSHRRTHCLSLFDHFHFHFISFYFAPAISNHKQ